MFYLRQGKSGTESTHLDTAWVNSKLVNDSQDPDGKSVFEFRTILEHRSKNQLPQYQSNNTLDFRLLEPRIGPIEKAVKVFMPLHWLGKKLLVSHLVLEMVPLVHTI